MERSTVILFLTMTNQGTNLYWPNPPLLPRPLTQRTPPMTRMTAATLTLSKATAMISRITPYPQVYNASMIYARKQWWKELWLRDHHTYHSSCCTGGRRSLEWGDLSWDRQLSLTPHRDYLRQERSRKRARRWGGVQSFITPPPTASTHSPSSEDQPMGTHRPGVVLCLWQYMNYQVLNIVNTGKIQLNILESFSIQINFLI